MRERRRIGMRCYDDHSNDSGIRPQNCFFLSLIFFFFGTQCIIFFILSCSSSSSTKYYIRSIPGISTNISKKKKNIVSISWEFLVVKISRLQF
jgi:hypothetical protein